MTNTTAPTSFQNPLTEDEEFVQEKHDILFEKELRAMIGIKRAPKDPFERLSERFEESSKKFEKANKRFEESNNLLEESDDLREESNHLFEESNNLLTESNQLLPKSLDKCKQSERLLQKSIDLLDRYIKKDLLTQNITAYLASIHRAAHDLIIQANDLASDSTLASGEKLLEIADLFGESAADFRKAEERARRRGARRVCE